MAPMDYLRIGEAECDSDDIPPNRMVDTGGTGAVDHHRNAWRPEMSVPHLGLAQWRSLRRLTRIGARSSPTSATATSPPSDRSTATRIHPHCWATWPAR